MFFVVHGRRGLSEKQKKKKLKRYSEIQRVIIIFPCQSHIFGVNLGAQPILPQICGINHQVLCLLFAGAASGSKPQLGAPVRMMTMGIGGNT